MIMSNSTYNQLTANLELLKLSQMKLHLDGIRDFVTANGLSFTEGLFFNEWDGIFFDAVVANAIMDRVLHHAHVIPISGKSYRLKEHLKQTD